MANYVEHARTNYFRVKDREAFEKDMGRFQVELCWTKNHPPDFDESDRVCVLFDDYVPLIAEDPETGEEFETDFMENWIAPHLQEGSIAVLTVAAYEGMRYTSGYAYAVNHAGDGVWVNTDQIYDMARDKWGKEVEIDVV